MIRLFSFAIAALCLSACQERSDEAGPAGAQKQPALEPTDCSQPISDFEQEKTTKDQIADLEREIESSRQIIDDLGAAVLMERTKLEDDPDYDQSFLNEILSDQDRERLEIEEAQKQLDALTR